MDKDRYTLDNAINNFKRNAEIEKKRGNMSGYQCNMKLVEWLKDYKRLLEKQILDN